MFQLEIIESMFSQNVNYLIPVHQIPISMVSQFMGELGRILLCIYRFQLSIEYHSNDIRVQTNLIVSGGIGGCGKWWSQSVDDRKCYCAVICVVSSV
jgi:hypothetical protein